MNSESKPADLVLRNGMISAAGGGPGSPGSVAVAGGRIVYAGPDAGVAPCIGPRTEVLELNGRSILPGFCDAHIHALIGGVDLIECSLAGCTTAQACLARIRDYAAAHPDLPCIRGGGWSHSCFGPTGPGKADLDRLVPDRPAAFKAIDGHSLWVNSRALELAGITAATSDPPGGRIERDTRTGEPAGTLREWAAMNLVTDLLPVPSRETLMDAGRAFMKQAARLGITALYDPMATPSLLDAYAALEERGELTLRVAAAALCEPGHADTAVSDLLALRTRYTGRLVKLLGAKIFLDGVIEAHTAFLLEPYADRPAFRGEPLWAVDAFTRLVCDMDREAFQVHVHAVGDAAARMALDAFEAARRLNGRGDSRHQIAHLDVLDPRDVPRFAGLGVVANVQPSWFFIDSSFIDSFVRFLGPRRGECLYRMQDLLDAGARVACSSDWPFGGDQLTCNPLQTLQVGATRKPVRFELATRPLSGRPVDLGALVHAHTRGGAYACFQEELTGSVEVGKLADLVVLDVDLFKIPLPEIHRARVVLTLFEGRPVYRHAGVL